MSFILRQRGFVAIEALLVIVIMVIIGGTGYFVYHSRQSTEKTLADTGTSNGVIQQPTTVNGFDACKRANGSTLQQTDPEQCVTKDGKSFTGPTDVANTKDYLVIQEWDIKFPLSDNTLDATYSVSSPNLIHLTTKRLTSLVNQIPGCRSGINDIYVKRFMTPQSYGSNSVKIGQYYYAQENMIESDCMSQVGADVETQTGPIQAELVAAVKNVVAE